MADSTSLVLYDSRPVDPEVIALAGFLAGYGGRTREADALDLRHFSAWCSDRQLRLFDAHRADIELYGRIVRRRAWLSPHRYTVLRRPPDSEGLSKREITRCLKRYFARKLFRLIAAITAPSALVERDVGRRDN